MKNQPQQPQRREDYKVQKLKQHLETKLALQAKALDQSTGSNSSKDGRPQGSTS